MINMPLNMYFAISLQSHKNFLLIILRKIESLTKLNILARDNDGFTHRAITPINLYTSGIGPASGTGCCGAHHFKRHKTWQEFAQTHTCMRLQRISHTENRTNRTRRSRDNYRWSNDDLVPNAAALARTAHSTAQTNNHIQLTRCPLDRSEKHAANHRRR